jgi:hypothetical protein
VVLAILVTVGVVLAGDIYLHWKYTDLVGLNVWGYRGPAVGRKQPNEWRLAVLGGSTAFGYGVHWRESIPAYLQDRLNTFAAAPSRRVSVVNLAYNGEGAHSFTFTQRDYDYLDYDAVLLYSGYNDLGPNTLVFRHDSAIFRLTGYLPLFPTIFREKAMSIRHGGRLEDAYRGRPTTFKPNVTQRATASALETAVGITKSLERQLAAMSTAEESAAATGRFTVYDHASVDGASCGSRWAHYCGEVYAAIKLALDNGKHVLMATQPYISPDHEEQEQRLREFLNVRFGGTASLRFANLGREVDLKDSTLAYDGMHLTPRGNQQIAAALEPHVRALMR